MGTTYWDWALALGVISLVCALISEYVFKKIAKELGPQVFVLALIVIITIAVVTLPALSAFKV